MQANEAIKEYNLKRINRYIEVIAGMQALLLLPFLIEPILTGEVTSRPSLAVTVGGLVLYLS